MENNNNTNSDSSSSGSHPSYINTAHSAAAQAAAAAGPSAAPQVTYTLNAESPHGGPPGGGFPGAGPGDGLRAARLILHPIETYPQSGQQKQQDPLFYSNHNNDKKYGSSLKNQNIIENNKMNIGAHSSSSLEASSRSRSPLLHPSWKSPVLSSPYLQDTEMLLDPYYLSTTPRRANMGPLGGPIMGTPIEAAPPGALIPCRLEQIPLPILEKIPGKTLSPRLRLAGPMIRVQLPNVPSMEGDIRRFCSRIAAAFKGAADDCGRLFLPCAELLRLPKFNNTCCEAQQAMAAQECKECGYKGHYCPACGNVQNGNIYAGSTTTLSRGMMPSNGRILEYQENCFERAMRWHCSLFEEMGEAIDQELLCDTAGGVFREFGEFIDNLIAGSIHAVGANCAGVCGAIPSRSRTFVEGYPLYEPHPKYLRQGRPTSATGNACVDQLNAFLDACLVDPSPVERELLPPPIPETQKTGIWLIDISNAALDYCLQDSKPPLPPPVYRKTCPIEMLVPPCCRKEASPVQQLPPPKERLCPLLDRCMGKNECPHCHQPIQRGGKCPAEQARGCQVQLCPLEQKTPPLPQPVLKPAAPTLFYPYKEEAFQVRDRSGLIEALDDHGEGVPLPHKITYVQ